MNIVFHIYKETKSIPAEANFIIVNYLNEITLSTDNEEFAKKSLQKDDILYKKITFYHPNKKITLTYWLDNEIINDPEFKMLMYGTRGELFYTLKNTLKQLAERVKQYNTLFKAYQLLQAQFTKLSSEHLALKHQLHNKGN